MIMISEAQCTVDSCDASADRASNDSSRRTRGSITSMRAFLCTAYQALRMRKHRR
jgi:hypothetical protein